MDSIFKEKKETVVGYCPQCDEEILSSHMKKYDGNDYWHEDCYENFMDMLSKSKKAKYTKFKR